MHAKNKYRKKKKKSDMNTHNLHKYYLPPLVHKSSSMMTQIKPLALQMIGNYTTTKNGRRQKDTLTRKQEQE